MIRRPRSSVPLLVFLLIGIFTQPAGVLALAQEVPDAPKVTKVEPPNWWIGLTRT